MQGAVLKGLVQKGGLGADVAEGRTRTLVEKRGQKSAVFFWSLKLGTEKERPGQKKVKTSKRTRKKGVETCAGRLRGRNEWKGCPRDLQWVKVDRRGDLQ